MVTSLSLLQYEARARRRFTGVPKCVLNVFTADTSEKLITYGLFVHPRCIVTVFTGVTSSSFFFFFFEETQDFPSFSPHHFFPVQKVYKHLRATEVLSAFVRLRAPIRSIGRVTAAHVRSQKTIVI